MRVVWSESAGSKHTVNMGMMLQALVPGMEHTEEADLSAEVSGIASDLKQSLSAGLKQQVINHQLVLQGQAAILMVDGALVSIRSPSLQSGCPGPPQAVPACNVAGLKLRTCGQRWCESLLTRGACLRRRS